MPSLRPVPYKLLVTLFERDGFVFDRQRGDHLIYVKSGVARPLVIPAYSEIPVFIIKNLLRTAGMSRDRYFELLDSL
jgi:predicted RNA binding protein YcfA (HicA-like mRNA interferase family)